MEQIDWPKYRFLFLLLMLMAGGIVLSIYGSKYWGHPAEAIGDAFIIAGALGLTVDGYVKSHLLKEASRDISQYLLGYHLPDEFQRAIKNLMFTGRISRDLHIHYKLSLSKDHPNKVVVEMTLTYSVENLGYSKFTYFQHFRQDAIYLPRFTEFRCDSNLESVEYHLREEDLLEQVKSQEGFLEIMAKGPEIEVPPRSSQRGATYQFTTKCISVYPQDFSDVFVFDYPCVGVFIKAEYPPTLIFEGPKKPDKVNRWFYNDRVFLGSEQITMRWRRRPAKA